MYEPSIIKAGFTLEWTESLSDYKASDGWALKYILINSTTKISSIVATASGDDHLISIPAATSANFTAGSYRWISYVEKGLEKYEIAYGYVTIEANLITAATNDFRSENRKNYELLLTAQQNWAANGEAASISIGGRAVSYRTFDELKSAIATYKRLVTDEELAADIAAGKRTRPRFFRQFGTD